MKTRSLHLGLLLVALLLALLAACSSSDAATRQYQPQDRPYFTGSIPPCTPVEGGTVEPCMIRADAPGRGTDSYYVGDSPRSMRSMLGSDTGQFAAHLVVRATWLPGTGRCEIRKTFRSPVWGVEPDTFNATGDTLGAIVCYVDVRANEYILGSGPPSLTLLMSNLRSFGESVSDGEAERRRRQAERDMVEGSGPGSVLEWVPEGGIFGMERILFVGPALDYSIEVLQSLGGWALEMQEDGTVLAVHPERDYWKRTDNYETYRSQLGVSLADFKAAVATANQERLAEWDGRVGAPTNAPTQHTDANTLHDFYVNIGAYDHPDGPPVLPPPVR